MLNKNLQNSKKEDRDAKNINLKKREDDKDDTSIKHFIKCNGFSEDKESEIDIDKIAEAIES